MTNHSVASRFLCVVVLVAGCASPGTSIPPTVTPPASGINGSPSATTSPAATPSPSPSAVPTAAPLVGMAWQRIADPDLDSGGAPASMYGVLAGGPGAIAWGYVYATGPRIWWSATGRDWQPASVPTPADAWVEEGYKGEVLDVVAGGPGFVAIGTYVRRNDATTAVIWTSPDGKTWQRVPDDPVFAHVSMGRVVVFRGELLAYGCTIAGADCVTPVLWSSTDGLSWTKTAPSLPAGRGTLDVIAKSRDRLFGRAHAEYGDTDQPTILTSVNGRTWTALPLRWLGPMTMLGSSDGVYALLPPMPTAADGYEVPSWWSKTPGIFRSTDLGTWAQIASPRDATPKELVAIGTTLILTGAVGTACWIPSNCRPAAWRSLDGGATWTSAPVTKSDGSPDGPGGTITAVAALADGTLVSVGHSVTVNRDSSLAAWVSLPTAP